MVEVSLVCTKTWFQPPEPQGEEKRKKKGKKKKQGRKETRKRTRESKGERERGYKVSHWSLGAFGNEVILCLPKDPGNYPP